MDRSLQLVNRRLLAALVFAVLGLAPLAAYADGPFQFHSVAPCRIVDTRNAVGTTGGPALSFGVERDFPIQGQCGVPSGAKAAVLNLTITQPTGAGHLTIWPSGTTQPLVSTLNYVAGEPAIANGAIVPLSANANDLAVKAGPPQTGTVHLIIDVTGYFQ